MYIKNIIVYSGSERNVGNEQNNLLTYDDKDFYKTTN